MIIIIMKDNNGTKYLTKVNKTMLEHINTKEYNGKIFANLECKIHQIF